MNTRNIVVALFVIGGVALFTIGLYLIGSQQQAFDKHVEFYTEFTNLGGLIKGARVQVAGMDAGQVVGIGIPASPSSRFRVKIQIREQLHGLVRTDSLASIQTEGVVGNIYLEVKQGSTGAPEAARLATLPSKEPFDLSAMLEKGNGLVTDADTAIKDADSTIKSVGGRLNGALDGVTGTVANVNDLVVGVKQGRGTVGLLMRDQQMAAQVRGAVANAKQATGDLAHASNQVDGMISDLRSRNLPQQVDDTMRSVRSASAQLDASSGQIHQMITEVTLPDDQGVDAGTNIRQSLSNLNSTTGNMADDTEALKHEFFFKGFFKHRGYYDLSHLEADQYLTNKAFTSPANDRLWISASELFETEPDGSEVLSMRGKQALDDAATKNGGSALGDPMVFEGYSGGPNVADQAMLSRRRAMLTSHYVENHFQLDPARIGFVALNSAPPAGTGKGSWDGICLVLLKGKAKK